MKKQSSLLISFSLVVLACTLLFSALFQTVEYVIADSTAVYAAANTAPTILLDAGHGGEDAGAIGINGVAEKDLNLSITDTLATLLRLCGYTVIETRTEDRLLYDPGTKKGYKKQGDLTNRLAFTTTYPNSVLISIHMNTYPNTTCQGTQVWYSENNPASKQLAAVLQERTHILLQPDNQRKIKPATRSIYILHHATTPAVLVECGFLSTPVECERLCDPTYRMQLSLSLLDGISKAYPLYPVKGSS